MPKVVDAMQKDSIIRPALRCLQGVWLPMIARRLSPGKKSGKRWFGNMHPLTREFGRWIPTRLSPVPVPPLTSAWADPQMDGFCGKTRMAIHWIPYTENSLNSVLELCENNSYLCRKHWDASECMMTTSRE